MAYPIQFPIVEKDTPEILLSNITVQINYAGGGDLATISSDRAGENALPNPFSVQGGHFLVYGVEPSTYDITIKQNGSTIQTYLDVPAGAFSPYSAPVSGSTELVLSSATWKRATAGAVCVSGDIRYFNNFSDYLAISTSTYSITTLDTNTNDSSAGAPFVYLGEVCVARSVITCPPDLVYYNTSEGRTRSLDEDFFDGLTSGSYNAVAVYGAKIFICQPYTSTGGRHLLVWQNGVETKYDLGQITQIAICGPWLYVVSENSTYTRIYSAETMQLRGELSLTASDGNPITGSCHFLASDGTSLYWGRYLSNAGAPGFDSIYKIT